MTEPVIDLERAPRRRFATLARLGRKPGKSVPFVQQLEEADCGVACLAMVLGYFEHHVALDELRDSVSSERGSSLLEIKRAAARFGLLARGVSVELDALAQLPRACILHWSFHHFVVFDGVNRDGVAILDPATGRRTVPLKEFSKFFTGVALIFEPTGEFKKAPAREGRFARLFAQVRGQRALIARAVVVSVLLRVLALGVPILTALIVDRVVPRADTGLLMLVAAGLTTAIAFHMLSTLIRAHLLLQLRTNLDIRMTLGFLEHLVSLPYGFFQRRSTGDLMMRVTSNTTIRELLTSNALSALLDGPMVVLNVALLLVISPALGAVTLLFGALQVGILVFAGRPFRELMSQNLEAQARSSSQLVQMLGGIQTLKLAGAEHRSVEKWSHLFVDELNASLRRGRLGAVVNTLQEGLQLLAPVAVLTIGAALVLDGSMSLGSMLAANALAIAALGPLVGLADSALSLQELGSYVERIDDLLRRPPEQDAARVVRAAPLRGRVTLESVSFRFGPTQPLVVRDVSLEIPAGACVAIVGASGSGKSSLAGLLLGLYAPTEGRVFFDGRPLDELEFQSVRSQLGVVPQSPFVFSGSIRDNIALGHPGASLERVVRAAKRACIHDDIMAMPMGYDAIVADQGSNLSGGQRQRIAIARALLQRPALVLLDEATSALDSRTEREVMHALAQTEATRILIAHRLSTIVDADLIVVMDRGTIAEWGRHRDLLARRGIYHRLVEAQTAGAAP